jgi:hypothetical protein
VTAETGSADPAFWRVTLTWPRPPGFGEPDDEGYVPFQLSRPDEFAKPYAMQLRGGVLEAAELRGRMIRVVVMLPAVPARRKTRWERYATSAQLAVEWAVDSAQFGWCCTGRFPLFTPLPEPVRIKVEPAGAPPVTTPGKVRA